ncbi:hypothetical protein DIPPA_11177 [Diplonema papillatum]|nr:hypothetical protein DIPPA_11177 [Diplonema papillatum]
MSQHDFECTCDGDTSLFAIDGPATCASDECRHNPCADGQECNDPNPAVDSLNDFTCTCDNKVKTTGGSATCELDECDDKPCGAEQTCVDEDKRFTSRMGYLCECKSTGTKARGQPADCSEKATSAPDAGSAQTMTPGVPNPPPTTPPVVTTAEKAQWNEKKYKEMVSEKTGVPVHEIEVTTTPNGNSEKHTLRTTFTGDGGEAASTMLKEELDMENGDLQKMGVGVKSAAEEETESPADEDSGMPAWLWLLIAIAVLGCAGGVAHMFLKKNEEDVSLADFVTQTELGSPSYYTSSPPNSPTVTV